MYSDRVFT